MLEMEGQRGWGRDVFVLFKRRTGCIVCGLLATCSYMSVLRLGGRGGRGMD